MRLSASTSEREVEGKGSKAEGKKENTEGAAIAAPSLNYDITSEYLSLMFRIFDQSFISCPIRTLRVLISLLIHSPYLLPFTFYRT